MVSTVEVDSKIKMMAGAHTTQMPSAYEGPETRQLPVRSPSSASDMTTRSVHLSVPHASPPPDYIAQNAASELITSEVGSKVLVSQSALNLLNEFLDQVLYNILVTSRSTSLSSLKAAVPTVLKPRLGKAAVKVAEEELKEYLNDDEELELHTRSSAAELKHDFDADLAWKLARLRCMVYTRLGDLEEEDEEEWLEKDELLLQLQTAKQVSQAIVETGPASAIFLTSIVEYLGEQALYYAAQHAQKRHYQNGGQQILDQTMDLGDAANDPDAVVIGGKDMNHVGRDSPLSRLWRSYRRNTRDSSSAPLSPELRTGFSHSRGPSAVSYDRAVVEQIRSPDQIPLPLTSNDVNEIEVPGLAPTYSDNEDEAPEEVLPQKRRPSSMIVTSGGFPGSREVVESDTPDLPEKSPLRPNWSRQRSISSPPSTLPKASPQSQDPARRVDSTSKQYSKRTADDSNITAEDRLSTLDQEQQPPSKTDGGFGAMVPALAGALGAGALGLSTGRATSSTNGPETLAHEEVTLPRKTVAEEMLRVTPSVGPPTDATTGASITNMSDFYSMHVPVAMSPGSSFIQASPVTSVAPKGGAYFPTSNAANTDSPDFEGPNPYQMDGAADERESRENLRPAPLRSTSGRAATGRPTTASSGRQTPTVTISDVVTSPTRTYDPDQPVSATSTTGSRPHSSGSAILGTVASAVPVRGAPVQARHARTDSHDPISSIHSRNVSGSAQTQIAEREGSGPSQAISSQRTTVPIDDIRATSSPSAPNVLRETPYGTRASSVSKRFHGKPLQLADESDEAKKKSLEILIRGNETLHYTLTPAAALRDEQKSRNQAPDLVENLRGTSSSGPDPVNHAKSSAPSGIASLPPKSPTGVVQRVPVPQSPERIIAPVSPTRSRNPMGQPRDARTEKKSSTRDLADYARSTGPLDAKQLPQSIGPRVGLPASPKPTATSPRLAALGPPSPAGPKSPNRLKYQARDARPSRGEESSELIDFIREGPSSATREGREHRIDRRVAPFRTTMDSEDFDSLAQGRGMGSSLRESEDGPHISSVDPSVTSQTPLIVSNGQTVRGVVPAASTVPNNMGSDGMPKRTRRRIKDPYAIYDSDDEEFADEPPRPQEESLMDFLRNTSPPPGMTTQPILAGRPGQRSAEPSTAAGVREFSPHLTQSGSKVDKYRPTQPTHAAHVDKNRSNQPSPATKLDKPRAGPRFEARDAKATRANTSELAEYLKSSGPPPNAQYQPQPFILSGGPQASKPQTQARPQTSTTKDDSKLFKRFSKPRKK